MIDREKRDKLAELLCRFRNNEITAESLMSSWPGSRDEAISDIGTVYGTELGMSHVYHNDKLSQMKLREMPNRESIIKELNKVILFLQTDLEYEWQNFTGWDFSCIPFQLIAFLIAIPFFSVFLMYIEEIPNKALFTRGLSIVLSVIAVLGLVFVTLAGGSRLRSLLTGIDGNVWPFYRRRHYRDALESTNTDSPA
jgi:hypothetical protein